MPDNYTLDTRSNACKNAIYTSIRTALSTPNPVQVPKIDKNVVLFDPIQNPLETFYERFTEAGGKCVAIEVERSRMGDRQYAVSKLNDIYGYVRTEIDLGRYNTVLNASPKLSRVLMNYQIPFVNSIPLNQPADAAILYAEYLIARNGSIVFSQKDDLMLYPSARNIARNLIVLAGNNCLMPDIEDVFRASTQRIQEDNRPDAVELQANTLEIIRPTIKNKEEATPSEPYITLVLLVER